MLPIKGSFNFVVSAKLKERWIIKDEGKCAKSMCIENITYKRLIYNEICISLFVDIYPIFCCKEHTL